MRIDFNISQAELGKFHTACEAAIRNVGAGTKAATEHAGVDIMSDSLGQVPIDTGALISSSFLGVSRRGDTKGYVYGAVLGYGNHFGLGGHLSFGDITWLMRPADTINAKSGLPASSYAAVVHEDLDMPHPRGGKAKFLEDPVREWAAARFARTALTYWKKAIEYCNTFSLGITYIDPSHFGRTYDINKVRNSALRSRLVRTARRVEMREKKMSFVQTDSGIQRKN